LTTKKSKPASLTSSLLARKGEAEPATAPYSIPESGRQRPADAASGKGNGNGSGADLGHALTGMPRSSSGEQKPSSSSAENGKPSDAVRPAETAPEPEAPAAQVPESDSETPLQTADSGSLEAPDWKPDDAPEDLPEDLPEDVPEDLPEDLPEDITDDVRNDASAEETASAEEVFAESAVAEEVSIDEAIIEAAVSRNGAKAEDAEAIEDKTETVISDSSSETPAAMAAVGTAFDSKVAEDAESVDGADGTDNTDSAVADEVDREAVRDARLLRFVYAMAALTGIVAIVLYAGGWLRDVPKQGSETAPVASVSSPTTPDLQSPAASGSSDGASTETAMTAPQPENAAPATDSGAASPVIPSPPPVTPPGGADEKMAEADSGVTTGGPAKPAADAMTPSATDSAPTTSESVGVAVAPTPPSDQSADASSTDVGASTSEQSSVSVETPAIDTSGAVSKEESSETAVASGASTETSADAGASPVVPTPVTPEKNPPPPVATEPVRDVPNLRVLAPALVKPEQAETAPPAGAEKASPSGTTGSASAEQQTAALPKVPPVKPAAIPKASGYMVQLASVSSETVARREWARLQKVYPDLFGDRTLVVEKKEIAGRGTFYRIQTGGYDSLDEARAVCAGLKAKKQGCLPIKR